jgi:hypothetical protein
VSQEVHALALEQTVDERAALPLPLVKPVQVGQEFEAELLLDVLRRL